MRMKRFSAVMAAAAASALVLSACTSGDAPEATPDATGGETTTETDGGEEPDGGEAGGELAPCQQPLGITETAAGEVSYTAGDEDWAGFNDILAETYSTYNSVIAGQMRSGFVYFGTDGTICRNESFGTFEAISGLENEDEPLVIEYTISDDAVWSDGTPVTINDYLFDWAAQNPEFLPRTDTPVVDDAGEPVIDEETGEQAIEAVPPFGHVSSSFPEYVPEGPKGEIGGKTFTVEYSEKYPDWQLMVGSTLPSHVVAAQNDMTSDELAQAIVDRDGETVASTAEFFNNWLSRIPGELPDPAIAPSSGPYQLMAGGWVAGEYLTLEPNPEWWGEPPATEHLVYRFIGAENVPTSMANLELNVADPQATVDTVDQLNQLGDIVTVEAGDTLTWEHLDFNFAPGATFADDGGGGLALREAFALCVPRQLIVDTLVKPVNPDAVVMNAREVFPFQDNYDAVVSAAYDGRFDEVDIAAATAKFEEAGVTGPVDVAIGYGAPNVRRTSQVEAIKASCDQVGFNVTDASAPGLGAVLAAGDWDVALFAWAGSGQIASGQNIYATGMPQNFGGFSNAEVDEAWSVLAASLDPEVQLEQVKIIEKGLWDNLHGIPMFAHPGLTAYTTGLENVRHTATQDQSVWNASQWAWAD